MAHSAGGCMSDVAPGYFGPLGGNSVAYFPQDGSKEWTQHFNTACSATQKYFAGGLCGKEALLLQLP